jgi:endonuclease YncB( thermonuclease family)
MRFIGCLVSILLVVAPAFADVTGTARVVDGDTIHIGKSKIRLHGIDAPESKQTCAAGGKEWPCGQEATQALVEAISGQPVTCKGGKRDRYKRLLAVCYVGDVNLNAMMVRNGWALAYRRYSTDYVDAEGIAEKAKAGLWRGEFEKPWVWRRK